MAAVFHRQTEPYSSHEAGDSIYDHSGEKVKTSVLGFAIALTLGFSAIELVAGWLGNSLALVGDAGHMVTDSMSLLFALVANIFSRHGADEDHSFGHGRLEALAAFVNGIVMSGVIVWIVIEAGKRMMNPEPVSGGSVMMVATIGLIVNVGVAWSLSRDKKNVNTRAALVHVMGDLLGSVSAILASSARRSGSSKSRPGCCSTPCRKAWSMKRWVTRSPRSQVSCGCTIFTSGRWLRDTPRSRLMSTFRTPITGPRCSTRSGIRWPRNSGLTTCRYSPNGMPARSTRIPAFALIVELRIISCFFLTQSANS